jgi:hypothetical protein
MPRGNRRWRYNTAPSLVDIPLTVDEAQDLLENFDRSFLKDESAVEHFVLRVLASLHAARDLRANMDREISRRTSVMPSAAPAAMSPEQAARYLTPEQLERFFDRFKQQQLELLRNATSKAETEAARHRVALVALEHLAVNLGADQTVPSHAREEILRALDYARRADENDGDPL